MIIYGQAAAGLAGVILAPTACSQVPECGFGVGLGVSVWLPVRWVVDVRPVARSELDGPFDDQSAGWTGGDDLFPFDARPYALISHPDHEN